jgi:hypothetical protein
MRTPTQLPVHGRQDLTERLREVPDTQLPDDDERDRGRMLLWVLVVVVLLGIAGVGWIATRGTAAQTELVVAEDQRDAAAGAALGLAAQVQQACATGDLRPGDPLCVRASEVQAEPIPAAPAEAGRGITGTSINPAGHLIIAYSDGTTDDVGVVVGAAGADGEPGRGIAGTVLDGGRLVITYTDGSRVDVGPVVGADGADGEDGADGRDGEPGRGVVSTDQVDGRLIISYTDGSTEDAGPLLVGPQGPQGDTGRPGPDCPEGFEPVETGPTVGADGTRYGRSITCVDPSSALPPTTAPTPDPEPSPLDGLTG